VTWPIQDLADAFFALARSAPGSPALTVYDGTVPAGPDLMYALVYFYIETPDGLKAPDAVSLTLDSTVIDAWAYVHCISRDPQAARGARAVSGRFRNTVLDKTLTVPGRSCSPIRWDSGQPPDRSEASGVTVFDQVDVYTWRSVPA
jgi:hypothetical protein